MCTENRECCVCACGFVGLFSPLLSFHVLLFLSNIVLGFLQLTFLTQQYTLETYT